MIFKSLPFYYIFCVFIRLCERWLFVFLLRNAEKCFALCVHVRKVESGTPVRKLRRNMRRFFTLKRPAVSEHVGLYQNLLYDVSEPVEGCKYSMLQISNGITGKLNSWSPMHGVYGKQTYASNTFYCLYIDQYQYRCRSICRH